ncbi:MAG: protein phosphatase 2C family protein [Bdellovibrionales bacterium]|nr:protein phosphatase 2C family protein [Bdellovibrionales bacterium]
MTRWRRTFLSFVILTYTTLTSFFVIMVPSVPIYRTEKVISLSKHKLIKEAEKDFEETLVIGAAGGLIYTGLFGSLGLAGAFGGIAFPPLLAIPVITGVYGYIKMDDKKETIKALEGTGVIRKEIEYNYLWFYLFLIAFVSLSIIRWRKILEKYRPYFYKNLNDMSNTLSTI